MFRSSTDINSVSRMTRMRIQVPSYKQCFSMLFKQIIYKMVSRRKCKVAADVLRVKVDKVEKWRRVKSRLLFEWKWKWCNWSGGKFSLAESCPRLICKLSRALSAQKLETFNAETWKLSLTPRKMRLRNFERRLRIFSRSWRAFPNENFPWAWKCVRWKRFASRVIWKAVSQLVKNGETLLSLRLTAYKLLEIISWGGVRRKPVGEKTWPIISTSWLMLINIFRLQLFVLHLSSSRNCVERFLFSFNKFN